MYDYNKSGSGKQSCCVLPKQNKGKTSHGMAASSENVKDYDIKDHTNPAALSGDRFLDSVADPNDHLGPVVVDMEHGERVCQTCGQVVEQRMPDTENKEKRTVSPEDYFNKSRTGAYSSLAVDDMGLSTVINTSRRDASGNNLPSKTVYDFNRLRVWDERSKHKKSNHRSMKRAFTILASVKPKLGLPEHVVQDTSYLYRKAISENLSSGRNIRSMVAACAYAACKRSSTPRSLHEVAKAFSTKKKDVTKSYRAIMKQLDEKTEPYSPDQFISKMAYDLNIGEQTRTKSVSILNDSRIKYVIEGKTPLGIAAGAIYIAAKQEGDKVTFSKLASASGVSSVSIRKVAKELKQALIP